MTDARPETRTTVVDWSGRRMLAVREPASVGPQAWGLLRRLVRVEGFGGIAARWADPRLLVSRITEVLAETFGTGQVRPWDFLSDVPEGEVLALRSSPEAEEATRPVARPARRPGLFAARAGTRGPVGRPGGRRRESGGLAAEALGFVRLRSEVPMGTAMTSAGHAGFEVPDSMGARVGPARGGIGPGRGVASGFLSRGVRLQGAPWSHFPTSRGSRPSAPLGAIVGARGAVRASESGWTRGHRATGDWSGVEVSRAAGFDAVAATTDIATATAARMSERMGLSSLALEGPEFAMLTFPRRPVRDRESPAVYPERTATRSVRSVPDATTPGSGRGSRRAAARKAGSTPEAATPSVARATFTPRRAGVEAPWFAPPVPTAPVFGRSLGSVAMAPVQPRDARSDIGTPEPWSPPASARPMAGAASMPEVFTGPVQVRTPHGEPGGANPEWSPIRTLGVNLSRLVAASSGVPRVPEARAYRDDAGTVATATFLDLGGRTVSAGGPEGLPARLPRAPARRVGTARVTQSSGVGEPRARTPSEGPPLVYPERIVSRIAPSTSEDVAVPEVSGADTATPDSGVRTATFVPRRAGMDAQSHPWTDVLTVDEVLAALGMKGLWTGGGIGSSTPVVRTGTAWDSRVSWPGIAFAMPDRREDAWAAPWAFASDEERALLAVPGMVRTGTGIPTPRGWPSVVAEPGSPRIIRRGSPDTTLDSATPRETGAARSWRLRDRPHPAVSGAYGTTPLARIMAVPVGMIGAPRDRVETADLAGRAEAATWMAEGWLRPGRFGAGDRPHPVVSGAYGTTPLARIMAVPVGTIGAPRDRVETADLAGRAEAATWMAEGLLRLSFPGAGDRLLSARSPGTGTGRPGAATTPGRRVSRGNRFVGAFRREMGLESPRPGDLPLATATRFGSTPVTRTLAFGTIPAREARRGTPVPDEGTPVAARSDQTTVGMVFRPGEVIPVPPDLARSEEAARWGFAGDVEGVFLRFPWVERLQDVEEAVVPAMTRIAGKAARRGSRETVAPATVPMTRTRTVAGPVEIGSGGSPGRGGNAGGLHAGAPGRRETVGRGIPGGESAERAGWKVPSGAEPGGRSGGFPLWAGVTSIGEDRGTLLMLSRSPEREPHGTPEGSRIAEGSGPIPARAMWFLQRTLGRALRALPPESFGEVGPAGEAASGRVPADLARLLGIVPVGTRAAREAAGSSREGSGGVAGDLVIPPGTETTTGQEPARAVRPERVEARTPGLPEEPVTLELSLQDAGPAGPVVGPGTAPSLGGLIRTGETPGPALRGLPLVSPVIQAVASQAMLSRRTEGAASRPTPAPGGQAPATGSQAAGSQPIDLDVLAMEMAERIVRRMKRDKERRGHHD